MATTLELRGKDWAEEHKSHEDAIEDEDANDVVYQTRGRDRADMRRMGKQQKLRRNFRVVAISSFSVVSQLGWVYIPINGAATINAAGTGGGIVITIGNFAGFLATVLSLAEMSSIAPTAGGQYHWTSEFAPPNLQRFLSYVSGWLSSLSWLVGVSSGMFLAGNLCPVLINLAYPSFNNQPWHGYLFSMFDVTLCFIINGYLARHLPLLEGFALSFMVLAFVGVIATLLVLSPKLSGSEVFQSFTPSSELGSRQALELVASQLGIFYSFLGSDSTVHMAEETQHAAVVIPRAMVWSYCINSGLVVATLITVSFCWVAPELYTADRTGYAFLELFITATGSPSGAIALTSILILLMVTSSINFEASTSRQVFAFARDNGLPGSKWIAKVNKRLVPMNSLIVCVVVSVVLCLIGLGSTTAFNAIISLQVMALAGTYQVSLMSLVWRRLYGRPLPHASWTLGAWGLPLNIVGIVYGWYLLAFSAMPSTYPVTPQNMNWGPVMFGGVFFLCLVYYAGWARHTYKGPVVHVLKD